MCAHLASQAAKLLPEQAPADAEPEAAKEAKKVRNDSGHATPQLGSAPFFQYVISLCSPLTPGAGAAAGPVPAHLPWPQQDHRGRAAGRGGPLLPGREYSFSTDAYDAVYREVLL